MIRRAYVVALLLCWGACDDAPDCYQGEYQACYCGEARGYQRCDDGGYGVCVCDGPHPSSASSAASGGGDVSMPMDLPFGSDCVVDEECSSGLCYPFNAKGPHCSQPCSVPEDCPPGADGCSGMGICKVP